MIGSTKQRDKDSGGMLCPSCGKSRTNIIDSRPADMGRRRRHICYGCEGRFTTYEILKEDFDRLQASTSRLAQLQELLRAE